MTTDALLIEKREELKRKLAAGEYKTLVDVFLGWFDRLIRKIARRSKPLPIWYNTVILIPIVLLIDISSVFLANDVTSARRFLISVSSGLNFLCWLAMLILPIASTAVIKQYIDRILAFWHDEVLNVTESLSSLYEFEAWLRIISNHWLHFVVVLIGGTAGGFYLISIFPVSSFSGYGFTFSTIVINLFNWNIVYLLIMIILLSLRLRQYNLKLFTADPASSELVNHLSSLLSFAVYFVAIFASILTPALSLVGLLGPFGGSLLFFFWLPIIFLFILNQTSLSSIIHRAKWKTLNEIQAQVEELRTTNSLKDKETMDAINRLMDYHDRVKATRNSAIDSRTILNFINSLLLPLLAFFLGNLDNLLVLFRKTP